MKNDRTETFSRVGKTLTGYPSGLRMSGIFLFFPVLMLLLLLTRCQTKGNRERVIITDDDIRYDLTDPAERWDLIPELREISGLGYTPEGWLAAVQDEKGILFLLDFRNRDIVRKIHFAKNGDYEGVEISEDTAFVLKSNGDLYIFNREEEAPKVEKVKTPLTKDNDTEGLAYDPLTKSMLIGCKGKAAIKGNDAKGKAIYTFDPSLRTLSSLPGYLIKSKTLKESLYSRHLSPYKQKGFRISGLAVHPRTHRIYIIGTVGKLLIILDRDQKIRSIADLPRYLYVQPEGICFDQQENMYIASEGKDGKGYILKFTPLSGKDGP